MAPVEPDAGDAGATPAEGLATVVVTAPPAEQDGSPPSDEANKEGEANAQQSPQPPDIAPGSKQLVEMVAEVVARISPQEDVREYLGQMVLPTVGPAIEQLLHHVHESGELQKALKEKEAESRPAKEKDRKSRHADREAKQEHKEHAHENGDSHKASKDRDAEPRHSTTGHRKSRHHADREGKLEHKEHGGAHDSGESHKASKEKDADARHAKDKDHKSRHAHPEATAEATEPPVKAFDPLIWLADLLRQSATTPEEAYRDVIQKRIAEVKQRRKEEEDEAAALAAAQAAQQEATVAKDENGAESTRSAPPSRG
mmetsp:Transcript_75053/g.140020  ORF Transcript_75053/g.140020 Transcript_75053/m.140020 type:complete len:314 (+) Transcript_75053:54-995(+)